MADASARRAAPTAAAPAHSSAAYRIRVDLDLCQGHGVCVNEAPEVFDLDADERKVVLRCENPSPELREKVDLAVRHCPTHALSIED